MCTNATLFVNNILTIQYKAGKSTHISRISTSTSANTVQRLLYIVLLLPVCWVDDINAVYSVIVAVCWVDDINAVYSVIVDSVLG